MGKPVQVEGSLFTQGSSDRQPAVLSISEAGRVSVRHLDSSSTPSTQDHAACDFKQLDISPRLGNTPRHIGFGNGSSFETSDNDKIDGLLVAFQQGVFNRVIHFLESHLLIVLLVVVLVSAFLWGSIKYCVPTVANYSAKVLPVEVSQYLGQGTLEVLDETVFSTSELPVQRQNQLSRLFLSYIPQYSDLGIKIEFRQGKKLGANAIALPDGQIIFTDEMVDLSQDDLELVAIFAHEVGHVVHRHVLRRVIQDSLLAVLVVMMTGDMSSASSIVYAIPSLLLELAYSREFESDADDFAFQFLIENDIETFHFANIMLRLMESLENNDKANDAELAVTDQSGDENKNGFDNIIPYLSTHPTTKRRVEIFLN